MKEKKDQGAYKNRISDKIKFIKDSLGDLDSIIPERLEDYEDDLLKKAACERYFERIICALVDLSYLFIKYRNFDFPESETHVFEILQEQGTISNELSDKLIEANKMRNVIAHLYADVNDKIVFNALKNELKNDAYELIKNIEKVIE